MILQKVHWKLTLLCTGITAFIMLVMSLIYLHLSETQLFQNELYSFENDLHTMETNLEQQSIISMEWIAKMEAYENYQLFLFDNGTPFLYNQLHDTPQNQKLLKKAQEAAEELELPTKKILCGFKPDGLRTLKCFPPGKRFNRYGLFDRKRQFPADFCLLFAFPPTLPVHRTEDFLRVDYRIGNLAFVCLFLFLYEKAIKAHCRKSGKAASIRCFCLSRAPHTVGCHPVQCRML